uniref:Putative rRNA methyltransferase n=1 Tax=Compsopogon caeruleus TaxID=31354 RepID=A0A6T6BUI9_9RHOD|mmetsp:Transcript_17741/g.36820  ORF Transcript_17741/g.36820 Transcript_17741/m.36820 type:complete len:846 (+) Transcript_17741:2013-4550(+)
MAKKNTKKTGKSRQDKYYQLAKEQGFRSRASFKLIQLNRRYDFLTAASHGVLDLCAAPGGWLQVVRKYAPVGVPAIGVDLVPIRNIPGVQTLAGDITSESCRADIRRLLKEAYSGHDGRFSVVLNDGSPNMGTAWLQDAFAQNELTLRALHLATEFLRAGGWFVTKVFRSSDYTSLLFVMNNLFKKVVSTKPAASRNESAEIYVICQGYLDPKRIDHRLLDPKFVFADLGKELTPAQEREEEFDAARKLLLSKKKRKPKLAEGYAEGSIVLVQKRPVIDFIRSQYPLSVLAAATELVFKNSVGEETDVEIKLRQMSETTEEILELCHDLRVLGRGDFKRLLKWRVRARRNLLDEINTPEVNGDCEESQDTGTDEDENTMDDIRKALLAKDKRKKKRLNRMRSKRQRSIDLKMTLPGDEIDSPIEAGLFSLKAVSSIHGMDHEVPADIPDCDTAVEGENEFMADESSWGDMDSDEEYTAKVEAQLDNLYQEYLERRKGGKDKEQKVATNQISPAENVRDGQENAFEVVPDRFSEESEESDLSLSDSDGERNLTQESVLSREANLWFSQPLLKKALCLSSVSEEDGEVKRTDFRESKEDPDNLENPQSKMQHKSQHSQVNEDDGDTTQTAPDIPAKFDSSRLSLEEKAEILAIGKKLKFDGRHKREDILDDSWNRYSFDDDFDQLPVWFRKEDLEGRQRIKPVTKEEVDDMKAYLVQLQGLPSKKVAEARARKRIKLAKRFDEVKQRANAIVEQTDIAQTSKAKQIESLYKKSGLTGGRKAKRRSSGKQYMVSTAGGGKKAVGRSQQSGPKVKGQGKTRYVDRRLKKDKRGIAKTSKNQKVKRPRHR